MSNDKSIEKFVNAMKDKLRHSKTNSKVEENNGKVSQSSMEDSHASSKKAKNN